MVKTCPIVYGFDRQGRSVHNPDPISMSAMVTQNPPVSWSMTAVVNSDEARLERLQDVITEQHRRMDALQKEIDRQEFGNTRDKMEMVAAVNRVLNMRLATAEDRIAKLTRDLVEARAENKALRKAGAKGPVKQQPGSQEPTKRDFPVDVADTSWRYPGGPRFR